MTLKQKLRARTVTVGSWLTFDSQAIAEMLARSSFEWLVIDLEHSATDVAGMCAMIRVIELAGCAPLVRVGSHDPLGIKKALDAGAHGIIVPMVSSRQQTEQLARVLRYPPAGDRGVGLWRAQGYGRSFEAYRAWAAENVTFIVQIEHWQAVDELPAILAVDAVDGFMIGPYDLSGSLGAPGDFQSDAFKRCIVQAEEAGRRAGKAAGFHLVYPDREGVALQEKVDAGYSFVAYSSDMLLLADALEGHKTGLRSSTGQPR